MTEACWLLALTMVPIFFNLYSARHFEPDKAVTLRSLALIALAAVVVRWIAARLSRDDRPAGEGVPPAVGPPFWRRFAAIPLAIPVLLYALVYLVATLLSVVPATSFWGSYQRLQGTYTNLSYIMLFVAIVATLRRREQLERIVTVSLAAGLAVAGYGVLQHFGRDPLPWRGDVITRVASTMGNSIFVAAYMIMLVPLALYRVVTGLSAARAAPASANARAEWGWALSRLLLLGAGLALLLAMIKFGAAVRTIDFRYWWVLPGAVVCATALWWLLTIGIERAGRPLPRWPAALMLVYLLAFGVQFAATAGAGIQVLASIALAPRAVDWWFWLFIALALATVGYALALTLPRLAGPPSQLGQRLNAVGAAGATLLLLAAIFFTQSRGPWLGLGAGLFVFCSLLLWQALRQARAAAQAAQVARLRALLIGWVALAVTAAAFLLVFNLSDAPIFERLRAVPYLGRMGRLLEVNSGTGLVRRLIWVGDEHAGGAAALITSDPLRAVVGWGPESMFVAFNPFYPPSLANIEARGASPDRSHQALLDELATRGVLGLASYLFLVASAVVLSWRLIRRSEAWHWQVFFIACLSVISANVVEGLTGIPIVSTLTMFWVTLALLVTGGALAGHYQLALAPVPAPAEAPAPPAPSAQRSPVGGKRRQPAPRGAVARLPARGASTSTGTLLALGLVTVIVLGALWRFNLSPIVADMHFQQGQGIDNGALDLNQLVQALDEYLQTVRGNPREDFYYLNLGRVLMSLADSLRVAGVPPGTANPAVSVDDLLRLRDREAIIGFVQRTTPMEVMSYAEAVLLHAHNLNPRNKDHYANLGRLNTYWYSWSGDPTRLHTALDWYEQVTPIAPQDVTLLNERAGVTVQMGDYDAAHGDPAQARQRYEQARDLLQHSATLDPRYADTYLRLGDLTWVQDGDPDAAVANYVQAIERSGALVANAIERIADGLADRPDLLVQLRDAYVRHAAAQEQRLAAAEARRAPETDIAALRQQVALLHSVVGLLSVRAGNVGAALEPYRRAAELEPGRANYSRNYAIVLSDTRQYDAALAEARRSISVLRGQPGAEAELATTQQLIALIEAAQQGQ